jgi:hypothetical protein
MNGIWFKTRFFINHGIKIIVKSHNQFSFSEVSKLKKFKNNFKRFKNWIWLISGIINIYNPKRNLRLLINNIWIGIYEEFGTLYSLKSNLSSEFDLKIFFSELSSLYKRV